MNGEQAVDSQPFQNREYPLVALGYGAAANKGGQLINDPNPSRVDGMYIFIPGMEGVSDHPRLGSEEQLSLFHLRSSVRLLNQIVHVTLDPIDVHRIKNCPDRFRFRNLVELAAAVYARQLNK